MHNIDFDIDIVVPWVDGSDPAWLEERSHYKSKTGDMREARYRDWGLMRYWFRAVEKYAPWVRKIHFITWGHIPEWLDTENPKLNIVRHEDYMPKEILPVFNSNVLEIFMHRIEGISENFLYFNDDMFIINRIDEKDFFRGGKPCDMLAFQPVVANPANPVMSYSFLNNAVVLSKHFKKRDNVKMQPGKYFHIGYPPLYFCYNFLELAFPLFTGFYTVHGPMPFCKSTFEELWQKEPEVLNETATHRFRSDRDVTPYLFREWQKLKGNFVAANVQKHLGYFNVDNDNSKLKKTLAKQSKKVVCINDANCPIEFDRVKAELIEAFSQILPDKCSFEK